jgi:DNA primase
MEGKPSDTPERRASIEAALLRRTGLIADGTVQSHYRREWRDRLWKAFRPPPRAPYASRFGKGRPGGHWAETLQPVDTKPGPPPDIGERDLLAMLLRRPDLISMVAEELAHLSVREPRHKALIDALLSWVAEPSSHALPPEGLEEQEPLANIENSGLGDHLRVLGLDDFARHLLTVVPTHRKWLEADQHDLADIWRHGGAARNAATSKDAVLAEATQAWNDSPTEENWQRLHALIEQLHAMSALPDRF